MVLKCSLVEVKILSYKAKTELRLPKNLKEELKKEADKKGLSLNQLIINKLQSGHKIIQ